MSENKFGLFDDFDKDFDPTLLALGTIIAEQQKDPSMINPPKMKEFTQSFEWFKKSFSSNVKITYSFNEPFISMGSMSAHGKNIKIIDPVAFSKATGGASNIEAYAKTDGTLQMTLTFHGLMKRIVGE